MNLLISVADIPNVWGPNVNSRSGKSNQSWAVTRRKIPFFDLSQMTKGVFCDYFYLKRHF
jgi:hypothetical protein